MQLLLIFLQSFQKLFAVLQLPIKNSDTHKLRISPTELILTVCGFSNLSDPFTHDFSREKMDLILSERNTVFLAHFLVSFFIIETMNI